MGKSFKVFFKHRSRISLFIMGALSLGLMCSAPCCADIAIKGGAALDQDSAATTGIWLSQDGCRDCLALNGGVIHGGDEHDNLFAGADWQRAFFDQGAVRLRGALGLAYFEKPLHQVGQQLNFHLGVGWEFTRHMGVYFDHWSNGRKFFNHRVAEIQNPPRNVVSIGVRF